MPRLKIIVKNKAHFFLLCLLFVCCQRIDYNVLCVSQLSTLHKSIRRLCDGTRHITIFMAVIKISRSVTDSRGDVPIVAGHRASSSHVGNSELGILIADIVPRRLPIGSESVFYDRATLAYCMLPHIVHKAIVVFARQTDSCQNAGCVTIGSEFFVTVILKFCLSVKDGWVHRGALEGCACPRIVGT